MELVDGPTLQERIEAGALPVDETLRIARQIAEALEYAHERGIIHRDLKPANVKLTGDGHVKVLDFGLAKALEGTPAGSGIADSPTLSLAATAIGVILGTAAYMSPEQAKGKPVDKRTDVFAFGCLLFEMLTGRRTFAGDDVSETLAYVITRQPDWDALPAPVSPGLRKLLRRCLEKDRKKRLADVADARLEIDEEIANPFTPALSAPAAPSPPTVVVKKASKIAIAAGTLGGAAIAAAAAWAIVRWTPAPPLQPMRFEIAPPAAQPLRGVVVDRNLAISPDGTHIVYVAGSFPTSQLMVRAIDRLEAEPLMRGVTGVRAPFMSPDGRWVGFFVTGELKKVSITGGPAISLCKLSTAPPRGASWGPDETIVFATADGATGLFSVPAGGGDPKVVTKPDTARGENDHLFPSFLPGGHAVLYTITSTGGPENSQVAVLDLETGQHKTLIRGGTDAEYVATGHLLYAAGGTLRAVRFDPRRLEVLSDAFPVVEAVMTGPLGAANYSMARNGTLAYVSGASAVGVGRTLVWIDRQGKEEPIKAAPREYVNPRISPDGTRLALRAADQEDDIWVWDFARETPTRLTFEPGTDSLPIWTPDSKRIIYRPTGSGGGTSIVWKAADGTGTAEPLLTHPNSVLPWAISPDATRLVVGEQKTSINLHVLAMTGSGRRKLEPLLQSQFSDVLAEISPDGRWLAYQSDEAGPPQIYVRPFPNVNAGRWQISTTGGSKPVWSRSGRELFYINAAGAALMSVPIEVTTTFAAGNPTKLFDHGGKYYNPPAGRHYDVSPDGKRFVMIKNVGTEDTTTAPSPTITVVLNWFEELKARTK